MRVVFLAVSNIFREFRVRKAWPLDLDGVGNETGTRCGGGDLGGGGFERVGPYEMAGVFA